MLDPKFVKDNISLVKGSEKRRGRDASSVDKFLEKDSDWRQAVSDSNGLKARRNRTNEEIAEAKKKGLDISAKIMEMKDISMEIKTLDEKILILQKERDDILYKIGNIVDKSVPQGKDKVVREGGKKRKIAKPLSHIELTEKLGLVDTDKAAKVSAARFYYLKGKLARLNMALIGFATDFLIKKGCMPMWTPFMLNHEAMKAAAELADFQDQLYKIEGEDLYLIATSEQTLASYHKDDTLLAEILPLKYAGFSTNFRREAGSHGKDTKGIFRVHQFDKVEQFTFCLPKDSEKIHEQMIRISEELYKKLGIPYRVVSIHAEDLNDNASKKYDLEGWFPGANGGKGEYRELVSCSNCTDYQARKLGIKYRKKEGAAPEGSVHTLNGTAVATQRTLLAILENHQQKNGTVKIPAPLVKYCGFKTIDAL